MEPASLFTTSQFDSNLTSGIQRPRLEVSAPPEEKGFQKIIRSLFDSKESDPLDDSAGGSAMAILPGMIDPAFNPGGRDTPELQENVAASSPSPLRTDEFSPVIPIPPSVSEILPESLEMLTSPWSPQTPVSGDAKASLNLTVEDSLKIRLSNNASILPGQGETPSEALDSATEEGVVGLSGKAWDQTQATLGHPSSGRVAPETGPSLETIGQRLGEGLSRPSDTLPPLSSQRVDFASTEEGLQTAFGLPSADEASGKTDFIPRHQGPPLPDSGAVPLRPLHEGRKEPGPPPSAHGLLHGERYDPALDETFPHSVKAAILAEPSDKALVPSLRQEKQDAPSLLDGGELKPVRTEQNPPEQHDPSPFFKEYGQGLESSLLTKNEGLSHNVPSQGMGESSTVSLKGRETPEIYGQVGRQVLWSLNNHEEKVRMALDPPELGTIYMEIKREEGHVRATVWTESAVAREILESHQGQLHQLLKEDGFVLDRFDVFTGHQAGWFQERKEGAVRQGPGSGREPSGEEGRTPAQETPEAVSLLFPSSGARRGIDLFI